MGFSLEISIPVVTVFIQGLLSFFSPCVLPILPLYISYLSGGTGIRAEDGRIYYKRRKVLLHTVCFVAGIGFAFLMLGMGASILGTFFRSNQTMFAKVGGVFVILFGLYQTGIFGDSVILEKERRLPFRLDKAAMSPWAAFAMGFTFSFAWTPCVGPVLAGVLLMAASAGSKASGFFLIGVYTLGLALPFLAAGFFTTSLLELFKKYMGVVKYTVKAGGVLLILLGFMMFTGKMNAITGYLSQFPSVEMGGEEPGSGGTNREELSVKTEDSQEDSTQAEETSKDSQEHGSETEESKIPAPGFELKDQYGQVHRLSDYEGKTILLNFWATWCPPCRGELPDIQKIYEEYSTEGEEALIVLGVAGPGMGEEKSQEEITAFLEENGYTYPVLMDETWELFQEYGIYAFPTTFMIDREGNVFGYASGQLSYDILKDIIRQTMEAEKSSRQEPVKVVATIFPYYDFTRQIAGDMVDLELIVPAGMDSHSFEPTPADMRKIEEADVVICNGGAMEHWVSQALEAVGDSQKTVVVMMDHVEVLEEEIVEGMEEGSHHGHFHIDEENYGEFHGTDHNQKADVEYDEHIWTTPVNAMKCTEVIAQALSQADPAHKTVYEKGKEQYQKELSGLHQKFQQVAVQRKRNTVVVGDKFPFRYLAEEYGFGYQAAFSGCSTDTEPSAKTIAHLIDQVKQEQIPAVYYLELSSHRVAEIIGEETGAIPLLLHSCHNVTRKEFDEGITYVELMEQNVENLRKGLDE